MNADRYATWCETPQTLRGVRLDRGPNEPPCIFSASATTRRRDPAPSVRAGHDLESGAAFPTAAHDVSFALSRHRPTPDVSCGGYGIAFAGASLV
jgi:hypothetical protein